MKVLNFLAVPTPSRSKFVTSIHSAFGRWSPGTPHLSTKATPLRSLALLSVLCALAAAIVAAPASAQFRPVGAPQITPIVNGGEFGWKNAGGGHFGRPGHIGRPGRFRGNFGGGYFVVEREYPVIVEREVVVEVPVEVPAPPPEKPREPFVIGKSYASLPGGCMKLIEEGKAFYYCDGEWYQEMGWGRDAKYKAVERRL